MSSRVSVAPAWLSFENANPWYARCSVWRTWLLREVLRFVGTTDDAFLAILDGLMSAGTAMAASDVSSQLRSAWSRSNLTTSLASYQYSGKKQSLMPFANCA